MNVEDIDIVGVQALERRVDLVDDGSTREIALVDIVFGHLNRLSVCLVSGFPILAHRPEALGHDDNLLSGNVVALEGIADDGLARTLRIGIGCIPRVYTAVVCGLEQW